MLCVYANVVMSRRDAFSHISDAEVYCSRYRAKQSFIIDQPSDQPTIYTPLATRAFYNFQSHFGSSLIVMFRSTAGENARYFTRKCLFF